MPETQVVLRNSERKLFKECQWKWQREYVDRMKLNREESVALWFGTGIHLAMEKYYVPGRERGIDPRETFKQYVLDSDAEMRYVRTHDTLGDFDEAVASLELGTDMLTGYLEEYGGDPWMDVIAAEQDFQVTLPYREAVLLQEDSPFDVTLKDEKAIVVGSIDLVFRDTRDGSIWLKDFKTAKALGTMNTQFLPMDDQAGMYCAVAQKVLRSKGLIGEKERVSGIQYDYLAKRKGDTRPKNAEGMATNKPTKQHYVDALMQHDPELDEAKIKRMKIADLEAECEEAGLTVLGDPSKQQPQPRFERKNVRRTNAKNVNQLRRVQDDLTSMSLIRNNVVRATKTTGTHCSYCPFLEICQLDEDNKDWSQMAQDVYTTWDPYESHRKEITQ